MPCKCSQKKMSNAQRAITKLRVTCPECVEGLVGADGTNYPLHLTPVIVSAQQVTLWKAAGHPVQVLL